MRDMQNRLGYPLEADVRKNQQRVAAENKRLHEAARKLEFALIPLAIAALAIVGWINKDQIASALDLDQKPVAPVVLPPAVENTPTKIWTATIFPTDTDLPPTPKPLPTMTFTQPPTETPYPTSEPNMSVIVSLPFQTNILNPVEENDTWVWKDGEKAVIEYNHRLGQPVVISRSVDGSTVKTDYRYDHYIDVSKIELMAVMKEFFVGYGIREVDGISVDQIKGVSIVFGFGGDYKLETCNKNMGDPDYLSLDENPDPTKYIYAECAFRPRVNTDGILDLEYYDAVSPSDSKTVGMLLKWKRDSVAQLKLGRLLDALGTFIVTGDAASYNNYLNYQPTNQNWENIASGRK